MYSEIETVSPSPYPYPPTPYLLPPEKGMGGEAVPVLKRGSELVEGWDGPPKEAEQHHKVGMGGAQQGTQMVESNCNDACSNRADCTVQSFTVVGDGERRGGEGRGGEGAAGLNESRKDCVIREFEGLEGIAYKPCPPRY